MINLPILEEWHNNKILRKFDNIPWNKAIGELHKPDNVGKYNSNFYRRLAYDEILSTFLANSEIRQNIKKIKKQKKIFEINHQKKILKNLDFKLTGDQEKTLNEINNDLQSDQKMFRLLQGDVGSGKTIVALCAAMNTVNSGFQVAIMAPTEILARQHFNFAKKIFDKKINLEILSSKSEYKEKKTIREKYE